jgi:hypothetical protein
MASADVESHPQASLEAATQSTKFSNVIGVTDESGHLTAVSGIRLGICLAAVVQ